MKRDEFKKILKPLIEQAVKEVMLNEEEHILEEQKKERIKRLNESAGFGSEVFENVKSISETDTNSPLSGVAASDAGVDISAIQKISNGKWKQLLGGK